MNVTAYFGESESHVFSTGDIWRVSSHVSINLRHVSATQKEKRQRHLFSPSGNFLLKNPHSFGDARRLKN